MLGVNTLYRVFSFFKLFIIGGKELTGVPQLLHTIVVQYSHQRHVGHNLNR